MASLMYSSSAVPSAVARPANSVTAAITRRSTCMIMSQAHAREQELRAFQPVASGFIEEVYPKRS